MRDAGGDVRGTAMEEVAGGAAVLVDPLDVASIVDGIAKHSLGATSSSAGRVRAAGFTWEQAADAVSELWSDLA